MRPATRLTWGRFVLPRMLQEMEADAMLTLGGAPTVFPPPGCRLVTMFRNMVPFDARRSRWYPLGYQRLRNRILRRVLVKSMFASDLVIFVSEHGRQVILDSIGRLPPNVVIPHGVDNAFFNDASGAEVPPWLPEGDFLLYVSNLEPYKAHVEVVRGFASLIKEWSEDLRLVLVGRESEPGYANRVRSEIARLNLGDRVVIAGAVPHVALPGIYQRSRIAVFASECENCPNVLLEAMASGRPLVVSNAPPMPEFAGDAVIYFNPRRPEEFAAATLQLLRDPEAATSLGASSVDRARNYTWETSAAKTWRAITELVSSG